MTTLLAVPNISEGRDQTVVAAIGGRFEAGGARLLDVHVDPDHNRSVFTLAGGPGTLALALVEGAREAAERIDMRRHDGAHPCVGAIDVVPVVHLDAPVFLYGALSDGRARSELRRGGRDELARRLADGEIEPDFGPRRIHPSAGAILVAARPPLVAFNLLLAPTASLDDARAAAAAVREGGEDGLPGVRAIGLWLRQRGAAQVSFNVEDPRAVPLSHLIAAVTARVPVTSAELVGLAPRAAFADFPADVPVAGFDPARHLIENLLGL